MTVLLDTNVLVRHFTNDPPVLAAKARTFLRVTEGLYLVDLIVAEIVYVLESDYEAPRATVAKHVRSALGSSTIDVTALAEETGASVASFNRSLDRVETVTRVEP